ncbi:hypothetical protein LXL04_000215 [Taraxacum kok-saghyz]
MSWIAWDKVLAKQECGGLGIGSLSAQNMALLCKWWWRFKRCGTELWKDVIVAIHGVDGGFSAPSRVKRKSSCWGNIVDLSNSLLKRGIDLKSLFIETQGRTTWSLEGSGDFTVGSLRIHIDNNTLPAVQQLGDWNNLILRKANILAWRLAHGRLPTKVNLAKRGIGVNKECTLCNIDEETEEHLFLNCPVTKEVWNDLRCWWQGASQTPNSINYLVKWRGSATKMQDEIQAAVFLVFLWVVWVHRNKKAHSSNLMSHKGLANEIQILSHLWINARIRRKNIDWRSWCTDPKQSGLYVSSIRPVKGSQLGREWANSKTELGVFGYIKNHHGYQYYHKNGCRIDWKWVKCVTDSKSFVCVIGVLGLTIQLEFLNFKIPTITPESLSPSKDPP